MPKKKRVTPAKKEAPMIEVVVFDGLKPSQRFNVGRKTAYEPGQVVRCEMSAGKPKDEAIASAVAAKVASVQRIPDPDHKP